MLKKGGRGKGGRGRGKGRQLSQEDKFHLNNMLLEKLRVSQCYDELQRMILCPYGESLCKIAGAMVAIKITILKNLPIKMCLWLCDIKIQHVTSMQSRLFWPHLTAADINKLNSVKTNSSRVAWMFILRQQLPGSRMCLPVPLKELLGLPDTEASEAERCRIKEEKDLIQQYFYETPARTQNSWKGEKQGR